MGLRLFFFGELVPRKVTKSHAMLHHDLQRTGSPNSPGILSLKIGQPVTNCNRRFFNVFWSRNMSSTTYQKSLKI